MTAHGQLDLEGNEATDPRIERAAKELYLRDVKRRHYDARDDLPEIAKAGWPKVAKHYRDTVTTVLTVYGAL